MSSSVQSKIKPVKARFCLVHNLGFEQQRDIWGPRDINLGLHSRTQT